MLPTNRGLLLMLRLGLFVTAAGWGISFFFTFASWPAATAQLSEMGADRIEYQPLLDYWLKMASAAFGCIGLAALLAGLRPVRFLALVYLFAPFQLIVGSALVMGAVRNHLTPKEHPTFIPDIAFCFSTALLIGLPLLQARRGRR